jgi:hypothetical protein
MANEKLRLDKPDNETPRPERAKPEELRDWETVQQNESDSTQRLLITEGYLYRTTVSGSVALVFVPFD